LIGHNNRINTLTLLPNGFLASGSFDGKIMIWNLRETFPLFTLLGHEDSVQALCVVTDEYLASLSNDKTIKLWSLRQFDLDDSWTASDDSLNALVYDPKLNVLVSSGGNNEILVWDSRLWKTKLGMD
jgi:WD40 repeat protein